MVYFYQRDMKINELMIGDWVKCTTESGKVSFQQTEIEDFDFLSHCTEEELKRLEPIPLTEEILKANGWKYYRINDIWTEDAYKYVNDKIRSEYLDDMCLLTIKGKVLPCNIKFVHELQHALRLCGMSELADNLKLA